MTVFLLGYMDTTLSVHSTYEKAEEALEKQKEEFDGFGVVYLWIEEKPVDPT